MASSSKKTAVSKFMPTGYEYEFVNEVPDEYNCSICFHPMWRPVQTKCGHRFCKGCLQEANKRKKPPQCPEDRQELRKQDVFEDKATERRILSLAIKCPSNGCQWLGELRELKNHTCTPTSRELKSGQKVKKDKIPSNVTEERSLTLIPCVYQHFGCNVKTPRKDMDKHIVSNCIGHHFNFTSERLMLLENENLRLQTSQMEVERQFQNLKINLLKEKDERETIANELTSLKATVEQKLDKNLHTLNSQKGEFSKEIRDLRKQIKQQVDEQTKTDSKTAGVNTTTMNKDMAEKIERSRLRMETSIDELRRDFENKMEKTVDQLQQDLKVQTSSIRYQMTRSDFENAERKTKIKTRMFQRFLKDKANKLIEQNDARGLVIVILLCAIGVLIFKNYRKQLATFLLDS